MGEPKLQKPEVLIDDFLNKYFKEEHKKFMLEL